MCECLPYAWHGEDLLFFRNFNSMPRNPGMPTFTIISSRCRFRKGDGNNANLFFFRPSVTPPPASILAKYLNL